MKRSVTPELLVLTALSALTHFWRLFAPNAVVFDELALITKKFFRGQRADRAGTGLGLSIVARIVEDHRGSLQFRSTVGEGTTVVVRLAEATS